MKRIFCNLFLLSMLSITSNLNAFESDFNVRVENDQKTRSTIQKLVVIANFNNADLASKGGRFTVNYMVTNSKGASVYRGKSTITDTQTEVTIGDDDTGKITMKYDPVTNRLETSLVINSPTTIFNVTVSEPSSGWKKTTQISNIIPR